MFIEIKYKHSLVLSSIQALDLVQISAPPVLVTTNTAPTQQHRTTRDASLAVLVLAVPVCSHVAVVAHKDGCLDHVGECMYQVVHGGCDVSVACDVRK